MVNVKAGLWTGLQTGLEWTKSDQDGAGQAAVP